MSEQVERSDRSHHKTASLHRAEHGVRVLPNRPFVQQQAPETCQLDPAICGHVTCDGMLHPSVSSNDKIAAQPDMRTTNVR